MDVITAQLEPTAQANTATAQANQTAQADAATAQPEPATTDETPSKGKQVDPEKASHWNDIFSFLKNIIITVLVVWGTLTFVVGIYIQYGEDMYPRLRDSDLVLFYRLNTTVNVDEVVTFTQNDTRYTARVVALAGEVVNISEEGQLSVNGNIQQEEIYYATFQAESTITYPYTVPEGCVFLLGDFRTNATDSRVYGAVQVDDLDGIVIAFFRCRNV